jgi:hypothetical protein
LNPVTNMYPFMLAAADKTSELNAGYCLLPASSEHSCIRSCWSRAIGGWLCREGAETGVMLSCSVDNLKQSTDSHAYADYLYCYVRRDI